MAWPGSERWVLEPGHQSGGALLPEPVLTPQRHLRRQCWSQQEGSPPAGEGGGGSTGGESKCCAGVPRLGMEPDSAVL